MKIVSLQAENVKRLKAIEIHPDGSLVIVSGKNGAGKSSVLDSIWYALGGKGASPPVPIRKGQKSARATVDLGDFIVERRWTELNSTLTITGKDGMKIRTPQEILDKLVGALWFDPMQFVSLSPKDQLDMLRRVTGVDVSDLDILRRNLYETRTEVGRGLKAAEARLAGLPDITAPDESVDLSGIMADQQRALEEKATNDQIRLTFENAQRSRASTAAQIVSLSQQIESLKESLTTLQMGQLKEDAEIEQLASEVAGLQDPDLDSIKRRFQQAQVTNDKVQLRQRRKVLEAEVSNQQEQWEIFTAKLEDVDAQRSGRIATAKMPVEGISFGEDGVLLNGIPFEQASTSEQIRTSIAMGASASPDLKVLLVRRGESLDADSLAEVAKAAEENGLQVWMERVTDGEACGVVIEDGMVREIAPTT